MIRMSVSFGCTYVYSTIDNLMGVMLGLVYERSRQLVVFEGGKLIWRQSVLAYAYITGTR